MKIFLSRRANFSVASLVRYHVFTTLGIFDISSVDDV
jgi:hypothetical protein